MIGKVLGNRYEILEKLGEGGMAKVYKARCKSLNRYVSVKILKEEFSNDEVFVEKFKREALAAASLSHNNIVTIYDVGSENGINYIVLEYVDGKTLKDIITKMGNLKWKVAVQIAIQIARALECAHKNNIIHRDIKPHNILVTEEGVVKVTDFGIAKASNFSTITDGPKVLGSAHYFSPEQAKGIVVDCRTDIYSLGVVLYEMVTGRVPFDAESPVSVALKHIQEAPIPPKQINENIPDGLNKVIMKALEKEPIKRYQNIVDFLIDLKKVENNEEIIIVNNDNMNEVTRIMSASEVAEEMEKELKKRGEEGTKNLNEEDKLLEKNENSEESDDDEFDDEDEPLVGKRVKKGIIIGAFVILIITVGILGGKLIASKMFGSSKSSSKTETEQIKVPQVVGLKSEDAKKKVEELGLIYIESEREKNDKPEGTVIAVNPEEGVAVKKGSNIRVRVSSGTKENVVPDLTHLTLEQAKDLIEKSGLTLGEVTYEESETVPKDKVISQTPTADSKITEETKTVDLKVSKGLEGKFATVPNLIEKNLTQAEALLANSKLKLGEKKKIITTDKKLDGQILSQSLEPGLTVKEGTAINISYYKYAETDPNDPA